MIAAFADALVNPAPALPQEIRNVGNRFSIYRNNYLVSLIEALCARFPVAIQLVGQEYFEALAHAFVVAHPPVSPLMEQYGAGFSDFIQGFDALDPPPYLADIVRLEWARFQALNAAAGTAIEVLNRDALEAAFNIPFGLAAGAALVRSDYPVGTIWDHHQADEIQPVSNWVPEEVAVWRQGGQVVLQTLTAEQGDLLSEILEGSPFLEIFDRAEDERHAVQLIGTFTTFLHQGLLAPLDPGTE